MGWCTDKSVVNVLLHKRTVNYKIFLLIEHCYVVLFSTWLNVSVPNLKGI